MALLALAKRSAEALLSLCYPPHCAGCLADTPPGSHLCANCAKQVRPLQAPFCARCSNPFTGAITEEFVCSNCTDRTLHFDCAVAAYLSRTVVRDFIHHFKYSRQFFLRHQLTDWLAEGLNDPRITRQPASAFVPVPLHHVRRREREFNQAAVLAKLLTKRTGIPTWDDLQRTRYTSTQTRLDRNERMENLRGAFRVRQNHRMSSHHLILIDDVFTTGSTVEECSRVLRVAGAASVRVLTIARG